MCLPYFLCGLPSPSGGPRCCCDSCAEKGLPCCRRLRRPRRHRHHRRRCCLCYAAAAAAAVLLLSCCCAAAVVTYGYLPLLRVLKTTLSMLCFAMPTDLSFFRYEICTPCFFCDLMEFRRFGHRKHSSQSDAGMNVALSKFDGIISWITFIANTLINSVVKQ